MIEEKQAHPARLMDADISSLIKKYFEIEQKSEESIYIEIMMAYYLADINKMIEVRKTVAQDSFWHTYTQVRFAILNEEYSYELSQDVKEEFKKSSYVADLYFARALLFAKKNNHTMAMENFRDAYIEYNKAGAYKKAQTARMNTITAQGNIDPRKRLLASYIESTKYLIEQHAYTSAANIFVNIGDELFKIGAVKSAYDWNSKALKLLQDQQNTLQYFEALSHKCEILFSLGHKIKANEILVQLKDCVFNEIKELAKLIENLYLDKFHNIKSDELSPAWSLRFHNKLNIQVLGELSDELVNHLAQGEIKEPKIIEFLYPNIDPHDARNRLTTMISRINKFHQGLIQYDKERRSYKLSHNERVIFDIQEKPL